MNKVVPLFSRETERIRMQCLTLSRAVRNFRILSNVIAVWVRKWFEYNIVIYIYIRGNCPAILLCPRRSYLAVGNPYAKIDANMRLGIIPSYKCLRKSIIGERHPEALYSHPLHGLPILVHRKHTPPCREALAVTIDSVTATCEAVPGQGGSSKSFQDLPTESINIMPPPHKQTGGERFSYIFQAN